MGTPVVRRTAAAFLATALLGTGLAACSDDADGTASGPPTDLSRAASTPQADTVYPRFGNAGIDARSYQLDVTWDPDERQLTGVETLTFRPTANLKRVVLDFGSGLHVNRAEIDGASVPDDHEDDKLILTARVDKGVDAVLRLEYSGSPAAVDAPTERGTLPYLGWNPASNGEVTSIQQPYGAFTWMAVNDTPSDKAFHDVTLRVPKGWVGISNGALTSRSTAGSQTTTSWHGSAPAAPSAMTVAIGPYASTTAKTASGTPVTTWVHEGDEISAGALTVLPSLVDWLEKQLGPYPFATVGAVVIPGEAGSDTQETLIVPTSADSRSAPALVDQLAHQWWGNEVTPADWHDLWIAEGVPWLVADGDWRVARTDTPWDYITSSWREADGLNRRHSGGPTRFAPTSFGPASVEYGSALMWQNLRAQVGDEEFAKVLKGLPKAFADRSVTRADVLQWVRRQTGVDMTASAAAWLDGATTPKG
ncbi:M1 family aminopeptidase [Nocardioides jiangxiensis]|uniref:M1 family aminopeptidase n=1 Tax=Nocardioides jiangxiensis TaxID=3064524 RepID=A0ABT9B0M3_9ACTN|nr:M1 family aminopeptidase [Nocardioides sp. WY-20]MDO7868406.1 M1 family aminopeptidase [Nocardioides sp. WY-20]